MARLFIRVNLPREAAWLESVEPQDYSGVVVSSHIVENIPCRIATMLARLKKPYLIDPYTHIFGGDVGNIREKQWFSSLMEKYGLDMIVDRDTSSLGPSDLVDGGGGPTDGLRELVDNVVAYQRDAAMSAATTIGEFLDFEQGAAPAAADAAQRPSPYGIMPPYFFIDRKASKWLHVNTSAVRLAVEQKRQGDRIIVPIMIDRSVMLDREAVARIVDAYDIDGVDEFMVWPAYMDEKKADRGTLECLRDLVAGLARCGRPVTNMYGGLFTPLIRCPAGAEMGTTHSICYGEHRIPFTVGSPAAVVLFYQGHVHTKIPFSVCSHIESELGLDRCECAYCGSLQSGLDMAQLFELAGKHFLVRRMGEIGRINDKGAAQFLEELASAHEHAKNRDRDGVYGAYYRDFGAWKEALGGARGGAAADGPSPS